MKKSTPIDLYQEFFVDRDFERLDLFKALSDAYPIQRVLYPGSFVHVTPSFVFSDCIYVDTDKRTRKFFSHPGLMDFIRDRRTYQNEPVVQFLSRDYREKLVLAQGSVDLLISQYAGFISKHCKAYLKVGGLLLVNNSHGDASMAFIDEDYVLVGVVQRRSGRHRISDRNLDSYFVPKKNIDLTVEYLEKTQKGIGYTKSASSYLFQRVK